MGVLFASADREPGTFNSDFMVSPQAKGGIVTVNYTAEGGGTATLDLKLQTRDQTEDAWDDVTAGGSATLAFTQMTGVGEYSMTVYPGLTAAAAPAQVISGVLPRNLRAVAVVGTDNLTFSASFQELR